MIKQMRIFLLTFAVFLVCAPLFAATIRLNNGGTVEGDIVKEDDKSILVETETEWKRIPKTEIQSVSDTEKAKFTDTPKEESNNEEQSKSQRKDYEFDFGPSIGLFSPADSTLAKYHKINLYWGLRATLWKKQKGLSLEYGQYKDTYFQSGYSEDMTLLPLWLSLLYRGQGKIYGFFGGGIGLTTVKFSNNQSFAFSSSYAGYQLLVGARGETVGVTAKYSFLDTNREWSSGINFAGFTFLVEVLL